MEKNTIQQAQYITILSNSQLCMCLKTEITIPENDLVNVLNAVMERVDYSIFDASYSRLGRIEYSPRILSKVLVYGYMRACYSSRDQAQACQENIKFMYLLEGQKAPSHNTIARFRSRYLPPVAEQWMDQIVKHLIDMGHISLAAVFIDGTKILANANPYSFVWKKGTENRRKKLTEKIRKELPKLLAAIHMKWYMPEDIQLHRLKKLRKKLYERKEKDQLSFVHGKGTRKQPLQRAIEAVENWIRKLKEYGQKLHICGNRNSYSKTDHDATFMHMKEDHMRNGQLKPGYNVNTATASGFIIGNYISSDRNDTNTLKPFVSKLRLPATAKLTVDAGYESEENYTFFEQPGMPTLFVKPSNHEQLKSGKYKSDISRRENMQYDAEKDEYTCAAGKRLCLVGTRRETSATGFVSEKSIYQCGECSGCPLKEKCIKSKSKKPIEERFKVITVSKEFARQREEMEKRINSEEGKLLRVNRSIQAEGSFAMTKEDMNYRRFLLRGSVKVETEWTVLCVAYNILKLYHKTQNNRLGAGLIIPKGFPAGL